MAEGLSRHVENYAPRDIKRERAEDIAFIKFSKNKDKKEEAIKCSYLQCGSRQIILVLPNYTRVMVSRPHPTPTQIIYMALTFLKK